jgi:diacylglycerol kinase (ATP)
MSRFYSFTRVEKALLAVVCGMVLAGELFNTAVERTVDLATQEHNLLAKAAKDAAAGGVLVAAICSVISGVFLFGRQEPLLKCLNFFRSQPSRFLFLIPAATGAIFFIFTDWDRLLCKQEKDSHPF